LPYWVGFFNFTGLFWVEQTYVFGTFVLRYLLEESAMCRPQNNAVWRFGGMKEGRGESEGGHFHGGRVNFSFTQGAYGRQTQT